MKKRIDQIRVRPINEPDRGILFSWITTLEMFTEQEKQCFDQMLNDAIYHPEEEYEALVACYQEEHGVGVVLYGRIPLTDACYDIYWIAVDPDQWGKGIGAKLISALERKLTNVHARKVFIETSSQENYSSTRAFYEKTGFTCIANVLDFYKKGDHKLVFEKSIL